MKPVAVLLAVMCGVLTPAVAQAELISGNVAKHRAWTIPTHGTDVWIDSVRVNGHELLLSKHFDSCHAELYGWGAVINLSGCSTLIVTAATVRPRRIGIRYTLRPWLKIHTTAQPERLLP